MFHVYGMSLQLFSPERSVKYTQVRNNGTAKSLEAIRNLFLLFKIKTKTYCFLINSKYIFTVTRVK